MNLSDRLLIRNLSVFLWVFLIAIESSFASSSSVSTTSLWDDSTLLPTATPSSSQNISSAIILSSSSVLSALSTDTTLTASSKDSTQADSAMAPSLVQKQMSSSSAMSSSVIVVRTDSLHSDSLQLDSSKVNSAISSSSSSSSSSLLSSSSSLKISSSSVVLSSSSQKAKAQVSRRKILGPVKISRVHAAKNLKGKYRSPKKAMFLSLAIPGAGQFYVGSNTSNSIRGGIYMAIEAGLLWSWYHYTVDQYADAVNTYESYANRHYSLGSYEASIFQIYSEVVAQDTTEFRNKYLSNREDYCRSLYGKSDFNHCNDLQNAGEHRQAVSSSDPVSLSVWVKQRGLSDSDLFYRTIASAEFTPGWDDADSIPGVSALDLEVNDNIIPLGKSDSQDKYLSLRRDATKLADLQTIFLGGLILNHLVSAIDAALAAHQHNKALYQEDLTFIDKVRLKGRLVSNNRWRPGVDAILTF